MTPIDNARLYRGLRLLCLLALVPFQSAAEAQTRRGFGFQFQPMTFAPNPVPGFQFTSFNNVNYPTTPAEAERALQATQRANALRGAPNFGGRTRTPTAGTVLSEPEYARIAALGLRLPFAGPPARQSPNAPADQRPVLVEQQSQPGLRTAAKDGLDFRQPFLDGGRREEAVPRPPLSSSDDAAGPIGPVPMPRPVPPRLARDQPFVDTLRR